MAERRLGAAAAIFGSMLRISSAFSVRHLDGLGGDVALNGASTGPVSAARKRIHDEASDARVRRADSGETAQGEAAVPTLPRHRQGTPGKLRALLRQRVEAQPLLDARRADDSAVRLQEPGLHRPVSWFGADRGRRGSLLDAADAIQASTPDERSLYPGQREVCRVAVAIIANTSATNLTLFRGTRHGRPCGDQPHIAKLSDGFQMYPPNDSQPPSPLAGGPLHSVLPSDPVTTFLASYALFAVVVPVGRVPTVCPFRLLTRHRCPLCGLTRATHALARGHPRIALTMNPLVLIWPSVVAWLIFAAHSSKSARPWLR